MKRGNTLKKVKVRHNPELPTVVTTNDSTSSTSSSSSTISLGYLQQLSPNNLYQTSSTNINNSNDTNNTTIASILSFNSTKLQYHIGCHQNCDYIINDPYISSYHCYIQLIPITLPHIYSYILHDTSTNGTYVNNTLIHQTSCPLKSGDHIDFIITKNSLIGSDRLSFQIYFYFDEQEDGDTVTRDTAATATAAPDATAATTTSTTPDNHNDDDNIEDEPLNKKRKTLQKKKYSKSSLFTDPPPPSTSSSTHSTSTPSTSTSTSIPLVTYKLEEKLQCSICCEILYQPSTLIPCMHTYCGGCISKWLSTSTSGKKCPLCNHKVQQINKNHILNDMIDDLIKLKPELNRTEYDKKELEKKNKIQYGVMLRGGQQQQEEDDEDEDEDEDDEDEDEEDEEDEEDDGHGHGYHYHPPIPPPPRLPLAPIAPVITPAMMNDISSFQAITGTSHAEATRYITGAAQRGLIPYLDNALSYYYEQMG